MYDMGLEVPLGCLLMDVELHEQLKYVCGALWGYLPSTGHLYSRMVHGEDFN